MADVVLKNKSGTPVTYAGVTGVQLKTPDGGVQLFSEGGESGGLASGIIYKGIVSNETYAGSIIV